MSLLSDIPKLQKMEQKATPGKWARGRLETTCIAGNDGDGTVVLRRVNGGCVPSSENITLICELRNAASDMLDVLRRFRGGDATGLNQVASYIELYVIERQDQENKRKHWVELAAMVRRLQEAARMMEAEGKP